MRLLVYDKVVVAWSKNLIKNKIQIFSFRVTECEGANIAEHSRVIKK